MDAGEPFQDADHVVTGHPPFDLDDQGALGELVGEVQELQDPVRWSGQTRSPMPTRSWVVARSIGHRG